MFLAQYQVLRKNGHSPSEAFNETVEEATQSLYPLIGAKGYVTPNLDVPMLYSQLGQNGLHVQRLLHHCSPRSP
jgi:hypothetical protein